MGSTCALLGPVSGGMSREAVERLLAGDPSIDIYHAREWTLVLGLLDGSETPFDVLIADFGTDDAPAIEDLLRDYPDISVAAINLSGFDSHFRNIDSRLFVNLIGSLGIGEPDNRFAARTWARAAWTEYGLEPIVDSVPIEGRGAEQEMPALCLWLDAVLSRVLARAVGLSESRDIAGLTMDVGTARKLLGAENAARDIDELELGIHAAEARLLARAGPSDGSLPPLARITERFGLDALERRILWLALAPDIDDRYGRVIGVINDDLARRRPTPALIAAALDGIEGEWQLLSRFSGARAFARFGLVAREKADADMPWPHKGLACPQDIVEMVLTGVPASPALTRIAA